MKHGTIRAIVHNVAASLGDGVSFLTGFYELDFFGDAARSRDNRLTVDFLTGRITEGRPQTSSVLAARRSADALCRLVKQSGGSMNDLTQATATYYGSNVFTVTVADGKGKRTSGDYEGIAGRRAIEMDRLGRLRRRPLRSD